MFDFIVAKIKRDQNNCSRGDVELQAGDVIVLAGKEYFDHFVMNLLNLLLLTIMSGKIRKLWI